MADLSRLLETLARRISLVASRGILRLTDDSTPIQSVQLDLLADETREVERAQNYGFSSHAAPDSQATTVFVNGNRDHGVVVALEDRAARVLDLEEGEVVVYTSWGDEIRLTAAGEIHVKSENKVYVDAPEVETTGNLHVGGSITCAGDVSADGEVSDGTASMSDDRAVFNAHTHNETGTGGGVTLAPNTQQ